MGPCMSNNNITQYTPIKTIKIEIHPHILIIQQRIASGAYGDIWKCKDIKTLQIFAIKQIKLQNQELTKMFQKEVQWLNKLHNIHGVVNFIGNKIVDNGRNINSGIIVTEFYQISLYDLLKIKRFNVKQILLFMKQMLSALKSIHELDCIHLDIKLQNILCKTEQNGNKLYYICDFGSCMPAQTNIAKMQRRQKNKLKQFIQANSTLIYRAPQMIQLNKVPITGTADIWMLGCIVYMLVYRKHPFEGQGQLGIMTGAVDYNLQLQLASQVNKESKQIKIVLQCIRSMLQINLQNRLNQVQLLNLINS